MKYTRDSLINKFNCGKINQSVTLIINLTSQSILKAGTQNTSRLGTAQNMAAVSSADINMYNRDPDPMYCRPCTAGTNTQHNTNSPRVSSH